MHYLVRSTIFGVRRCFLHRTISSKVNDTSSEKESPLRRLIQDASAFGEVGAAAPAEGELQWATQPYTTNAKEETKSYIDPKDTTVLLFPGQGSQRVGMGQRLMHIPAAKELYELASTVVGFVFVQKYMEKNTVLLITNLY